MCRTMRALVLGLAVGALLTPVSASATSPGAREAATRTVHVRDFLFRPGYTRIERGDTVSWRLSPGSSIHTVTSRKGARVRFDSGDNLPGTTFSRPFPVAGRYPYHCKIHPEMRGVVQVGPDRVDPKLATPKATVGATSVRLAFKLSEASRVSASVAPVGASKRILATVKARRLEDGSRALRVKTTVLSPGRYRATLRAKDPEGNAGVARVPFEISAQSPS
jgi:plastocyanin